MSKLKLSPVGQPHKLISYWKRELPVVVAIAVLGIAFNGSMSLGPVLQGNLLDTIISGAALRDVLRQCALFVAAILAIQILRFGKRYFVRLFANRTGAAMRMMIYNNMLSRPLSELENESAGDLMNRAIADVGICVEGMRKVTTEVFDTGVLMLGYVITLAVYDLRLTLLSCLFVPVAMFIAERLKKAITGYSQAYRKQSSRVSGLTLQNIEAVAMMRVNGMERRSFETYRTEVTDLSEKAVRANILENSMQPIYNAIAMLGMGFILYMGGQSVITGSWTVGMLSTYITIFTALAVKASKAAKLFNSAQKARVSWLRIKPYLREYQTKDIEDLTDIGAAELNVNMLTFSYPDAKENVLERVSIKAKAGEIIGVTGPVACGKSTLGIALQGLYPYEGHIRINGRELDSYHSQTACQLALALEPGQSSEG